MKVLVVSCDNGGIIGVARSEGEQAKWAVELLMKRQWLDRFTSVYYEVNGEYQWEEVGIAFGENWEDFMKNLTINEFNELWEGCFYLEVFDVHGVNNVTIW